MSITKKLISIGENGYAKQIRKFSKSHILVVFVSHAFTRKVFNLPKKITRITSTRGESMVSPFL